MRAGICERCRLYRRAAKSFSLGPRICRTRSTLKGSSRLSQYDHSERQTRLGLVYTRRNPQERRPQLADCVQTPKNHHLSRRPRRRVKLIFLAVAAKYERQAILIRESHTVPGPHARNLRLADRSAASFNNPDHMGIVIHNYRWRLGLDPAVASSSGAFDFS